MTNAFKLYLPNGKYRIIDEQEFKDTAKDKMEQNDLLRKKYINREINKLTALKIFQYLKITTIPINALPIEVKVGIEPSLKTIEKMEEDIEKYIFEKMKEDANNFDEYFSGSKEAMLEILEDNLHYKVIDEEKTLENFLDHEVYFTSEIIYKNNKIIVALTDKKFICDINTLRIYKYKSTILDEEGFEFNFKKNELFISREAAILESKKLVDEHYKLPIKNSKIKNIIVRIHDKNTIIIFWPDKKTEDGYIIANDIIGTSDIAGDTRTSLLFFNECKDATPTQVKLARDLIEKCMKEPTVNVRHL